MAYFEAALPTGYIRTIYRRRKTALSGKVAVIPGGYTREEKTDGDTSSQHWLWKSVCERL